MAVWWIFQSLFCIHTSPLRADFLTLLVGDDMNDMNQLKEIWISPQLWGRNSLFHVLISPCALLKRWHLEVSFAESGMNCFQSDTSKAAFSVPLACLTVTQVHSCSMNMYGWISMPGAAPLNQSRHDKKPETQSYHRGGVKGIYWFVYQCGEYNMCLEGVNTGI